jgi:hypothetical protein
MDSLKISKQESQELNTNPQGPSFLDIKSVEKQSITDGATSVGTYQYSSTDGAPNSGSKRRSG